MRNDAVTNAKRVQVPSCSSSNAPECCGALPPHRVSSGSSSGLVARCGIFSRSRREVRAPWFAAKSRMASTSLTSGAARYSKHFRSFASSTSNATYWSMWPTRPDYRRQPEEQHQLCSDQELAETVVVEPVGVGNFVTEQATQGQDVLSRRRDAASTRPKPGDTESGRHEVVKPAACIAAGQYQRRQSQGAPKQGGTSDYRYVSGRRS
jgi:hypothetical protein